MLKKVKSKKRSMTRPTSYMNRVKLLKDFHLNDFWEILWDGQVSWHIEKAQAILKKC